MKNQANNYSKSKQATWLNTNEKACTQMEGIALLSQASLNPYAVLFNFYRAQERFQVIDSASLCSLEDRYDNPIPTRFLVPIDFSKIQHCPQVEPVR